MSKFNRTIEIEVPLEFECSIDGGYEGWISGPPDQCYEGEGPSVDSSECISFSAADEFDIGRQARVWLSAGMDNNMLGRRIVDVVLEKLEVDAALQRQVEHLHENGDLMPEGPDGD